MGESARAQSTRWCVVCRMPQDLPTNENWDASEMQGAMVGLSRLLAPLHALSALTAPTSSYAYASPMIAHAIRLMPGDDLVATLCEHCQRHKVSAATVVSCVGSLSTVTLRMAAAQEILTYNEELEIVSLVGTLCADGNHHLHCSVSRRDGSVLGGHCKGPAKIRTTGEVVLGILPEVTFTRAVDDATGYLELQISQTK